MRDLSESNYSAYQEQISENLDWIEQEAKAAWQKQNQSSYLHVIAKVQELKMKHTNGENINISAALLGKKFQEITKETREKEEITKIKDKDYLRYYRPEGKRDDCIHICICAYYA